MTSLINWYILFSVILSICGSILLVVKEKHLTLFDPFLILAMFLGFPFLIPILFLAGLVFILEKLTNNIVIYGKRNTRTFSIH